MFPTIFIYCKSYGDMGPRHSSKVYAKRKGQCSLTPHLLYFTTSLDVLGDRFYPWTCWCHRGRNLRCFSTLFLLHIVLSRGLQLTNLFPKHSTSFTRIVQETSSLRLTSAMGNQEGCWWFESCANTWTRNKIQSLALLVIFSSLHSWDMVILFPLPPVLSSHNHFALARSFGLVVSPGHPQWGTCEFLFAVRPTSNHNAKPCRLHIEILALISNESLGNGGTYQSIRPHPQGSKVLCASALRIRCHRSIIFPRTMSSRKEPMRQTVLLESLQYTSFPRAGLTRMQQSKLPRSDIGRLPLHRFWSLGTRPSQQSTTAAHSRTDKHLSPSKGMPK